MDPDKKKLDGSEIDGIIHVKTKTQYLIIYFIVGFFIKKNIIKF